MASEQQLAAPAQERPKRLVGGAFGRFLAEKRAEIAKETPKCSEQLKIASRLFKELSEAEKAEWQAKFEQATAQYEKDVEAWREAGGEEAEKKRKAEEEASKADAKKRKADEKDAKKAAKEEEKRKKDEDKKKRKEEAKGASPGKQSPPEAEGEGSASAGGPAAVAEGAGAIEEPPKAEGAGAGGAPGAAGSAEGGAKEPPKAESAEQQEAQGAAGSAEGGAKRGRPRKEDAAKPAAAPKHRVPQVAPGGRPKWPAGGAVGRYLDKHRKQLNEECKSQPGLKALKLAQEKFEKLSEVEKKPFEDEYQKMLSDYHAAAKLNQQSSATTPAKGSAPVPAAGIMGALARARVSAKRTADGAEQEAETPPAKLPRAAAASGEGDSSKKAPAAQGKNHGKAPPAAAAAVELEQDIADEAEKAGLTGVLQKFLAREDVAASGKSQAEAFQALQAANGLMHPARRALLGA